MTWSDTLSDNGIMMEEGEAAQALALGISEKTALSGGTTSVDVSGMCSSLFESIDWGFCDAVDQVISVIAPRFVDSNNTAYSSSVSELITVAGFTTAVYGATNGEVRLRNGGTLFDSEWIEQRKGILNLFVTAATPVADAAFTTTSLNSNTWTVTGSTISGATTTLPHSVNAIGSTATPTVYYRGAATYETNVTLSSAKRYYLYLEPVYQRADVVLSGHTIYGDATNIDPASTGHVFTTELPGIPVVIDLTSTPFANGGNTITIKTDNTSTYYYAPFNGLLDIYSMFGGATLCEAGKLCFDPVTFGTRRCHLYFSSGALSVKVAVKSNSNQTAADEGYIVATVYLEGSTAALHNATTDIEIDPGDTDTYTLSVSLSGAASANPWNVGDGKRFRVVVQLYSGTTNGTLVDTIEDYCGYRTFSAAKHTSGDNGYGLTLNGSTCSLYGVTYHHWDRMPTTAELDADWELISALKPQMIRFAYFPALHYLLDKCDQAGIAAMLELPWMHEFHNAEWVPGTPESYRNAWRYRYQHNVTDMAVAMANEFFNHPSVLFYCIGTGFGVKAYHEWRPLQMHPYVTDELLPALRAVDSSRLVCIEMADDTAAYGPPVSWTDIGDVILERMNSGWGSGAIGDAVSEANTWNGKNTTIPMAILDWSYGANPAQHVEWSSASTKPADTGLNNAVAYPEEYQAYCVEQYADSALALKWPVFNLYGAVFDYAASNVSAAGGKSGVMQTGLVTRDRSVVKDAYYYLKARWNSEPMVYVTQKRNMDKESSPVTLRIYTNCNYVKVYSSGMTLLDTIQRSSGSYVVTKSVELEEGNNVFYVTGHATSSGESTCNDSVTVHFEDTSGTTRIQIFSDSAIVNSGRVNAVVLPSTEPQGISWSSETPTVATVNSGGTVTVLLDGSATIRATSTNDNTITKTKVIPCYVRGATDSLYYKACAEADDPIEKGGVTYRGINIVGNRDGSFTMNGTLTSGPYGFKLWPSVTGGTTSMAFTNRAMFPIWDVPGDQLITCEVTGGTITGTPSGSPFTLVPVNETYTQLNQAALKPMDEINGSGDVNAKLIVGSTIGFGSFWLNTTYPEGTVFDNATIRIQSFKQANTVFNSGLLESHMEPPNTVHMHDANGNHIETDLKCNMYSRNADGSHSELVANPNNGGSIPAYGRVTDGFAIDSNTTPVSGATIATAGTVLKFTAIMKNWPGNYQQKDDRSEWSFRVWYADGTTAAKLTWAYQDDDSGVDFTGGTASTIFTATKTVDSAGWYRHWFAWGNTLNCTSTCTFYLKLEEIDPTNVPPTTINVYGGDRIINSGKLGAVCLPAGTNQGVTWSSSNTGVATIDSSTGMVTVVADGQCTFTATSTLDNTKTGSATVSCRKVTSTNLIKNIFSVYDLASTVSASGVTLTNNKDGTYTLDGTMSSTSATWRNVPVAPSSTATLAYFPVDGIAGDMLVWAEYVSGTINGVTNLSDNVDLQFKVYDMSNSEISAARLNFKEVPDSSTECHSVLVTGSTAGVRRMTVTAGRPSGTVFSQYTFRLGLEKLSSLGLVYSGGVAESSMPAPCQAADVSSKHNITLRNPDGSFYIRTTNSLNWTHAQKAVFTLTGTPTFYGNMTSVPVTDVVAASGKTYKLRAEFLRAFTFDTANMSSDSEFRFFALGSNGTELATLTYYTQSAYSADFVNNVAETTFTATENVAVLGFYANKVKPQTILHFAISLTEVTT